MAENKAVCGSGGSAGIFARRVQKQLSRAQEKVLQKLGKTVETKDEQFELCSQNLHKQQSDGNRLLKDIKAYFNAVKVMHETSKRLSQSLKDVYEGEWEGGEDLNIIVESEDLLWNDYEEKLADQAVRTMENYISQFPEAKERVCKRGRKLVDYDSSRHHLEALQSAKKKDEMKIAKAEEEFQKAQTVFEDINRELREELPVLYQSRIGCYVTVFQNISNLRDVFYKEMSTLNNDLYNVMKSLEMQHSDKAFIIKGWESTATSTKKRRSLMISAPIPCNTAFPSDHNASLGPVNDNDNDQPEKMADEQQAAGPRTPPSEEASESEEPELNSEAKKTEEEEQKPENEEREEEEEENEREPCPDQTERDLTEDRPDQTPELCESDGDASGPPGSSAQPAEAPPPASADSRPTPTPRSLYPSVERRPSAKRRQEGGDRPKSNTNGVEAEPADVTDTEYPPGFLYKGVAVESHVSEEAGHLEFEEGDVILVLTYGEEMPKGMARGVKESDWIQHKDQLDHSGIFMENCIRRVEVE
ncbi:hypothetical protein AAFF_G00398720 [Aldrovandia affinis]|uniref:BAR domain-containing protein n=1 Tax=Aldrovandia affinis TaxID=143900 RepID=A0AAD7SD33_9TELE|nr:hypothetical protein AAFF_G00398720 [Aldrovandia affinis]